MGRRRSGRATPETVGLVVFRLASPLRQAVLAREDGRRERISARVPTSPRTGADQLGRLHPDPARRSTIGGLYDHRPVAPRSPLHGLFRDPGSIQRTNPGRNRFETTRPRSAYPRRRFGPDPNALPRDGDGCDYGAALNADHSAARRFGKRLILLGPRSRIPRTERLQSPYLRLPRRRPGSRSNPRAIDAPGRTRDREHPKRSG